jgi:PIN domain nuclease of toxin-antitoxin system
LSTLILDTQVALWWLGDAPRLTRRLRRAIETADEVNLSSASTWEVAIKLAIGNLKLDLDPGTTFASVCAEQGFRLTSVEHADAWSVRDLAPSRADPFDRLIAATALRRGWTVASADGVFTELGVPAIGP